MKMKRMNKNRQETNVLLNNGRMNKKGAEMTVGTIIVIILALVVLVVLILGFTGGWGQLWTRITAFFGQPNVASIVQACQVACASNANYDYCMMRDVKFEEAQKGLNGKYNCKDLEKLSVGLSACSIQCASDVLSSEDAARTVCNNKCNSITDQTNLADKNAICDYEVKYLNLSSVKVKQQ